MKTTTELKKITETYPLIECEVCNAVYIYIAIVERLGLDLDVVPQARTTFCPDCGTLNSMSLLNNDEEDIKKYNKKRLKIKGKDGYPIVHVNRIPKML